MFDPYAVLKVSKKASLEDIKKAYRKLAKIYHPDLNPGNKLKSEEKFKEILRAYELIGTDEERIKFDENESLKDRQQQNKKPHRPSFYETQQGHGRYSSNFNENFNVDEIFEKYFSKDKARGFSSEDELYQVIIEFKEAVLGGEKLIALPSGKKIKLKIPAGIEEGQKLKLGGISESLGDIYVQVSIRPLEGFKRQGNDILTDLSISIFEAITGTEINIPTVDGNILLKIYPGVTTGSKLRIKNKGVGANNFRGNQIVTLKIVMPKIVQPQFRQAMQNIEKDFSYNPRILI